jgi:hypothetical protein
VLVLVAVSFLGLAPAPAAAQNKINVLVQDTIFLSPTGDARYTRSVPLSRQDYLGWRKENPPAPVLAQVFRLDLPDWIDAEQLRLFWDDAANTIQLRWTAAGVARLSLAQNWELPLCMRNAKVLSIQDRTASLTGAGSWRLGETLRDVRVILPEGSTKVRLLPNTDRLSYRVSPPAANGQNPSALTQLQAKSHLLGCLAPVYADPKFGLWAARLVFKNSGDQTLRDYRVRFQVVGYTSDWGPWERCPLVAPGQTVVSLCFPVLDVEKIARITGVRAVFLKAQYQYRRSDGQLVEDSESVKLQLLGRNMVQYGSQPGGRGTSFEQNSDLEPFVMASLVTYQDPAIQQLAGRICHQIGGAAASLDEKAALRYMNALYNFMAAYVSYQTSPGDFVGGSFQQHVKFGRDVLKNHAGTCIDLAILFASACETVGLDPIMVSIPGHTFTGIRWQDHKNKQVKLYFVEATLIGRATFAQALQRGMEEFNEMTAKKLPRVITDIKRMRMLGLHPLELLPVADDWLARICPPGTGRPQVTTGPSGGKAGNLVGTWRTTLRSGNTTVTMTVAFSANGAFAGVAVNQEGRQVAVKGTFRYANGVLSMSSNTGTMQGTVTWIDANRFTLTDNQTRLVFTRVR